MEKIKRLTIKLVHEDHKAIKTQALSKNLTMTLWVIQAIEEKMKRENGKE